MAFAALVSLMQLVEHVLHFHQEKILSNSQEFEYLRENILLLQSFFKDSSEKRGVVLSSLAARIKVAAHDTEDVIESHVADQVLLETERHRELNNAFFKQDLQMIIQEFDSIKREMTTIKEGYASNDRVKSKIRASSLQCLCSGKDVVVGLDKDLVQIRDRLTSPPSRLEVVPIVGMGGIGKTTLARKVYDDPYVVYHFYTRAWARVSGEYCMRDIMLDLLKSLKKVYSKAMHLENEEKLGEYLYKSLKGSRYLIVMDDVWDTNTWDYVRRFFPNDNNGSRVILTTRLSQVASYVSSCSFHHHMCLLDDSQSWDLLREKVFGNEYLDSGLEEIGKTVAKNCKGLPLAILVIGGLLSKTNRSRDEWEEITENVRSTIASNDHQCMEILSLSFRHLPHHMKVCFLYMGVFPEDYEIPMSKLIRLWIAEGFIDTNSCKILEEVAEEYLEDLVERNLALACKEGSNGKIRTCGIHDLLREMLVRKAHEEQFICVMNRSFNFTLEDTICKRYLSLSPIIVDCQASDEHIREVIASIGSISPVRSFLFIGQDSTPFSLVSISLARALLVQFGKFRLLRVLDIVKVHFNEFPVEITKLINLRYLAFTYNGRLPSSISKLWNLQILIIHRHPGIGFAATSYLPSEIWKMSQLRHIYFTDGYLPHPPHALVDGRGPVCLLNLRTLSKVRNFRCSEEVFKGLPNLKKLAIWIGTSVATFDNLVHLTQLENLKCLFGSLRLESFDLSKVSFPSNLRKLTISGGRIPWKDMSAIGSLPNLEVLKLRRYAFQGQEWEPIEGQFVRLEYLLIERTDLVYWRAENVHFPCLRRLILRRCYGLKDVPLSFGEISTLELISLEQCSHSAVASAEEIQEEQQSFGNDGLEILVRH